MIDYLEGGSVGGLYGEGIGGKAFAVDKDWAKHWKKGEWNALRARIEGDVPRIRVWLNDVPLSTSRTRRTTPRGVRPRG